MNLREARSEGKFRRPDSGRQVTLHLYLTLRRSYVAALELRVEKLEGRLAYARSRKASVTMHQEDAPPPSAHDNNDKLHGGSTDKDRRDSLATIRAAIHRKAARKRENSDVNSLISDFGYLSVNATTRDFEPSVSNMTFARLVLAAASNDPLPTMAQLQQEEEADEAHNGSHDESVTRLPSRQYANALVQYYMSNMYALYPAFNETTLYTVLDDVYLQQQSQHQQLAPNQGGYRPPIKDADYWLLYMVLAIASTMQSRAITGDVHYRRGVSFVVRALPYADRALMPGYPTQIQSLVLLTQYSMFDPAHFDSWHLIGFTCRAVVDLGFHQDPPPAQQPEKAVLDLRRKTFWCVYALDRYVYPVNPMFDPSSESESKFAAIH